VLNLLDSLNGKKILFVASTGGHLSQLTRLAERFSPSKESLWVTFEKPQSISLLQEKRHVFMPYISPRDVPGVWSGWRRFRQILRREEFDAVVSTGAAIALSSHSAAVMRGVRTVYIESVSRFDGPSLTGRILQRFNKIERYAQHPGYDKARWKHEFSVLDTYAVDELWVPASEPKRIFVTLGTIHPYRFDALVDKIKRVAPHDAELVWQLGTTERSDLPGRITLEMSSAEFEAAVKQSDLVITHAGVGTIMGLLDARQPILVVPRRRSRKEHVDDHQLQITRQVSERGLAVSAEVDDISLDTLLHASRVRVQ
jgi:UDP-N-acetylglucosamine--N-acetylmuramyl-(pentapeptide) pyrophosphoryl-undecaprenol N-acetylglucosamine transferase